MRILIIGGTAFVGRHMARVALERGHEVTLFHRGKTGAGLFPGATHLTGDRNEDLSLLAEGTWDATLDMCGYFPRQVRSLAAALGGRGGRYVFISSVSAYSPSVPRNYDESGPLAEIPGGDEPAEVTNENYGWLKVACEQAATEVFGPATTIIRPTYVIGPYDLSYRFTWWVDRLARGGQVLAPGGPDDPAQVIDAADMAEWTISLLEKSVTGTFHAVSPEPPFGFGQMLEAIAAEVAPPGTELVWVPSDFLLARDVDGAVLPLWSEGEADGANMSTANPAAAYAAGLTPRPLRQSVADIVAAEPAARAPRPGIGIGPDREAEILAAWSADRKAAD
jgi:2'-hydroxyisoflavone reductase